MVAVTTTTAPKPRHLTSVRADEATVLRLPLLDPGHRVKRLLDVTAAAMGLLVMLPLLLVVALLVKIDSPGPVFFRQERVGYRGRRFGMIKFRSMVADAEHQLAEVADLNDADGLLFKIRNDPRVTRVGRIIRKVSLDEVPQLINVLRGEMSLVGPRPLPVDASDFRGEARQRLAVRPGITGPWQISGRSNVGYSEMIKLDVAYVRAWSVWKDLEILVRTVPAVFRGRGAY